MTTAEETKNTTNARLPKPFYAAVGVGELAYHRLQALPARVEELRERIPSRVRTLREALPGRVDALRTGVDERVNTFVAEARGVYGGLVAQGEKVVTTARSRRTGDPKEIAAAPVKAVRKAVKRAVKKAGAGTKPPKA
jgi:hypothetical protein